MNKELGDVNKKLVNKELRDVKLMSSGDLPPKSLQ